MATTFINKVVLLCTNGFCRPLKSTQCLEGTIFNNENLETEKPFIFWGLRVLYVQIRQIILLFGALTWRVVQHTQIDSSHKNNYLIHPKGNLCTWRLHDIISWDLKRFTNFSFRRKLHSIEAI